MPRRGTLSDAVPRRVIVTRPEADSRTLAEALRRRGIDAVLAPMLVVRPTDARIDSAERYRAAVVTSGNGIDGLAAATTHRSLPVFAVGEATAGRARLHGFQPVVAADGTGAALADLLMERLRPGDGPILWASGDEIRVDLAAELGGRGYAVDRVVVYRAEPAAALPAAAGAALADGSAQGVLFFSPRSASRFVSLVTDAGLAFRAATMSAHCLSPAVAVAVRALPWAAVRMAVRPTRDDLLATLDDGPAPAPD